MKNVQTRKIILTIMIIVKDAIMWTIRCLIAAILVSVCIENGWILSSHDANVSYNEFWKLYSAIYVLVPIIMGYRGITGSYKVEIKECKVTPAIGVADEERSDESNKCNKSVYLANKSIDMIDAVNKGYTDGYNKAIDDAKKVL